jgi:16S rRNA G527 N7-methylase RsmG
VEVFAGRGEELAQPVGARKEPATQTSAQVTNRKAQVANGFDLVTLRAVERFESTLDVAVRLLAAGGRLALLIGAAQIDAARNHGRHLQWSEPIAVPLSSARVIFVGTNPASHESGR